MLLSTYMQYFTISKIPINISWNITNGRASSIQNMFITKDVLEKRIYNENKIDNSQYFLHKINM